MDGALNLNLFMKYEKHLVSFFSGEALKKTFFQKFVHQRNALLWLLPYKCNYARTKLLPLRINLHILVPCFQNKRRLLHEIVLENLYFGDLYLLYIHVCICMSSWSCKCGLRSSTLPQSMCQMPNTTGTSFLILHHRLWGKGWHSGNHLYNFYVY